MEANVNFFKAWFPIRHFKGLEAINLKKIRRLHGAIPLKCRSALHAWVWRLKFFEKQVKD